MIVSFECCRGCKPPKRNPYCHSTCPEYLKEKEINDAKRNAKNAKAAIDKGLSDQRMKGVIRSVKRQGKRSRKGGAF